VTGANLKKRIEAIVGDRIAHRLTGARKLLLAVAGVLVVAGPVLVGLMSPPRGVAQSQEKLVFEVASVKRMNPAAGGPIPLAPGVTPGGGIRSHVSLFHLIRWAYRVDGSQLSGGPSWVRDDRYSIEAKPERFEGPDDPNVPPSEQHTNRVRERVKSLLADRFRLVVRAESREAPVYVLSVAKGGHKLTPDPDGRGGMRNGGDFVESFGAPLSFFAVALTHVLGRPVVDETGIDGRFKFRLEFRFAKGQDRDEPVADDDPRPSIFTAIKDQLGLELQSRKRPVASIVIERIERPTEN
jgi:uncharacterized protein (TIGR03435 family)